MLGPVLIILYMRDVPKCIAPKFADDLVTLADVLILTGVIRTPECETKNSAYSHSGVWSV